MKTLGKGSVRGRSSETPRMKQTVGQLLTYEHELRDLSNQVGPTFSYVMRNYIEFCSTFSRVNNLRLRKSTVSLI